MKAVRLPTKILFALYVALGIAFIGFITYRHIYSLAQEREVPQQEETNHSSPLEGGGETPIRLLIPALGIETDIHPVGVNTKGNMATPRTVHETAWYRHGAKPGEAGKAVLAGHLDDGKGNDGIFRRLGDLKEGDSVYVIGQASTTLKFRVVSQQAFDYQSDAGERVFGSSEKALLNLITCEGEWLPSQRTYDKRLVVFTEFERVCPAGDKC